MRSCGECEFQGRPRAAPSAACVLVFGRTRMDGDEGILRHMAALARSQTVARASAYCKRCRVLTWLCEEQAADLDAAALDFWRQWESGSRIARSMALMQKALAKKRAPKKKASA